ncbi:MAG: DNA repair exonuclease [Pirellulaceae bacterium]|jgi:DNA repair exonuclease SbcCD nuclease subunit|nr:DNA repair exonuclease [Pirellulaceae bacterium]MDP7019356.1 DNA repair exonuclease [Pirellulaceae bacterium]
MFRFIHTADLHIDSPLKGLDALPGAPAERLRKATRTSCERVIDLALEENVDFVVIAGDLFDGRWPDATTGAWTAAQFRRLLEIDAAVYLLWGNHDVVNPASGRWPSNVHVFDSAAPQTYLREDQAIAIHGQSFSRRAVPEDLAADYPRAVDGCFNIGVLHTSLTGDSAHDTYASTSEDVLRQRGYQYWALGHIHQRRVIAERPFIAFAGNTQGRHAKETGAKGCLLVDVDESQGVTAEFRATDVIRWRHLEVRLQPADGVDELLNEFDVQLDEMRTDDGDRSFAVRLTFTGDCQALDSFANAAGKAELEAELRQRAADTGDVWIEKIRVKPVDRQSPTAGALGSLLSAFDAAAADDQVLAELSEALLPLISKSTLALRPGDLDWEDKSQLRTWLREAREIVAAELQEAAQ